MLTSSHFHQEERFEHLIWIEIHKKMSRLLVKIYVYGELSWMPHEEF